MSYEQPYTSAVTGSPMLLIVVVILLYFAPAGIRSSLRPLSAPVLSRTRTMQTPGLLLSSRVTLMVISIALPGFSLKATRSASIGVEPRLTYAIHAIAPLTSRAMARKSPRRQRRGVLVRAAP